MKFRITAKRLGDGRWQLLHESPDVGRVEVAAVTRDEAVEKMVGEIRYRLELCPCTGESYRHLDIEVVDET